MALWIIAWRRRVYGRQSTKPQPPEFVSWQLTYAPRPGSWLAIRSPDPRAVRAALDLDHLAACPWVEGLTGGHGFFISAPVKGWIIVTGSGLPNPANDPDDCFHFLTDLSRKLGQVQFFLAERVLQHHAWVKVDNGVVTRAYVWAGETLWNQGAKTAAEMDLSMKCFGYGEQPDAASWAVNEWTAGNVAKVPLLAARWSLDPARFNVWRLRKPVDGIAGEPL